MRRQGGMTINELLIAMAIASFISTIVYTMFSGALNVTFRLEGEADHLRRSSVIKSRLSAEVEETDLRLATVIRGSDLKPPVRNSAPPSQQTLAAVAFPMARHLKSFGGGGGIDEQFKSIEATGLPDWKVLRIYCVRPGTRTLVALVADLPSSLPISTAELENLCNQASNQTMIADNVAGLTFTPVNVTVVDPITDQPSTRPGMLQVHLQLHFRDRASVDMLDDEELNYVARNSFTTTTPLVAPGAAASPRATEQTLEADI